MGDKLLKQHSIGRRKFETEAPINPPIVKFKMSCEKDKKFLSFKLLKQSAGIDPDGTGPMDIVIKEDCEIRIELDDSTEWHWPDEYAAITTKRDFTAFYKDLKYSSDGKYFRFYDEENKYYKYRHISFLAVRNMSGGPKGVDHPFNFTINLVNSDGTVLPISIDPDIRNPPPENPLVHMFLSGTPA